MRKGLVIYNPVSGGKKKNKILKAIEKRIDNYKYKLNFASTKFPKHAIELASNAKKEKYDFVIAVGGDGTINEVVNGLMISNLPLGIIPCGSGNGFARHCNIPMNINNAIDLINNFKWVDVDVIKMNRNYAINSIGFGFDALIAMKFSETKKRGLLNYFQLVMRNLPQFKKVKIKYHLKEEISENDFFMFTITNSTQFGNNIHIEPRASVQDGVLNLVCVKPFRFKNILGLTYDLFLKKLYKNQHVMSQEIKTIEILSGPSLFHIDGEYHYPDYPIKISVLPGALKLLC